MLIPTTRRRSNFRPGRALRLADGQDWPVPEPKASAGLDPAYQALLQAVIEADRPDELLRAELALGIHMLATNYDVPPLLLGALLDFPHGDVGLARFQDGLHEVAMDYVRAFEPVVNPFAEPLYAPRIHRRFGFSARPKTSMSA